MREARRSFDVDLWQATAKKRQLCNGKNFPVGSEDREVINGGRRCVEPLTTK